MSMPSAIVIEADPDLAIILSQVLAEAGYEAEVAAGPDGVLEQITQRPPEIAVIDLPADEAGGLSLLRGIQDDARLRSMRVVALAAGARLANAARRHADVVLIKPISFRLLRDLSLRFRALTASG